MSFRGRGRGRGGFGGGPRYVKEVPFEPFPEIEGLGTAEYSITQIQMVKWSTNQNKDCHLSPYYWEDISERPKRQKVDIERYSDRQSRATRVKPPLWDVIRLDTDYMPGEISRGGGAKRNKKFKLASVSGDSGWNKLEHFEELAQKRKGQDGAENKDDEDEDEDVVGEEDDGEFSDEGDYEQGEYCDDDEDDFNMADDNDDEPIATEIANIVKDFDEPGFLAPTGLFLAGAKYMVIQGEPGAVIRGKKGSGGLTVKKTGQALIFGLYEEPMTPGQCNMVVEKMGDYLIDQGL